MIEVLLPIVLIVGIASLAVTVITLQSSRRSEDLGEDRYDLLRDQHERLELMREERRALIGELERESQQRQQLMEALKGADPQLVEGLKQERQRNLEENAHRLEQEQERLLRLERELHQLEEELERERREHLEDQRRVEQLEQEGDEQSRIQQLERASQNLQQLRVDLEREREERIEAQRLAEQLGQEQRRLKQELNSSKKGSGSGQPGVRPWWRRPIPIIVLLLGSLIVWLTSLVVALQILNP